MKKIIGRIWEDDISYDIIYDSDKKSIFDYYQYENINHIDNSSYYIKKFSHPYDNKIFLYSEIKNHIYTVILSSSIFDGYAIQITSTLIIKNKDYFTNKEHSKVMKNLFKNFRCLFKHVDYETTKKIYKMIINTKNINDIGEIGVRLRGGNYV